MRRDLSEKVDVAAGTRTERKFHSFKEASGQRLRDGLGNKHGVIRAKGWNWDKD